MPRAGEIPCSIRPVRAEDAAAVAALVNEIIRDGRFTAMAEPMTGREQLEFIRSLPDRAVYLAAVAPDGALLGVQDVLPADGDAGEVSTFIAAPARRRGVGRRLTEATVAAARARGYRVLRATIRADNAGAIAFYRSVGLVTTGTADAPAPGAPRGRVRAQRALG